MQRLHAFDAKGIIVCYCTIALKSVNEVGKGGRGRRRSGRIGSAYSDVASVLPGIGRAHQFFQHIARLRRVLGQIVVLTQNEFGFGKGS